MDKKYFIIGSPGWLGTQFVKVISGSIAELNKLSLIHNAIEIRCLVHPNVNSEVLRRIHPKITTVSGDITQKETLADFFRDSEGGILFHFAGIIHPFDGIKQIYQVNVEQACEGVKIIINAVAQVPLARNKKLLSTVNINGTRNLFEAALIQKVSKIVHISSSAVFGIPQKNPVDESVSPKPKEPYGHAKYQAEQIAKEYIQKGLDITIIRPRTILGYQRMGIFSVLFDWVKDGKKIPVLGKGNNTYQFVHAEDLAEACLLAAERSGFSIYNIGAEDFGTMRELISDLIDHAKTNSKVISMPFGLTTIFMQLTSLCGLAPFAPYHWLMYGREMYFDIEKAERELGWQAKYSNSQMICESYDYYCREIKNQTFNNQSFHQKPVQQGFLKIIKKFL